jgi:hypothetical protein
VDATLEVEVARLNNGGVADNAAVETIARAARIAAETAAAVISDAGVDVRSCAAAAIRHWRPTFACAWQNSTAYSHRRRNRLVHCTDQ